MKRKKTTSAFFYPVLFFVFIIQSYTAKGQLITFETLAAPPNGSGGLSVGNDFPDLTFNFPTALDFSATPGFVHSGTKAIEICYGMEFCGGQLEITFNELQHHVKLWVGYENSLNAAQPVVMKAFGQLGNQLAVTSVTLGPSTGIIPVQNPLEINTPSQQIKKVTVSFLNAHDAIIFNNWLVFDDIEYDKTGASPACPAASPASLVLNSPLDGIVYLQNVFNLNAVITASYPFASYPFSKMTLTTTDIKGISKTFGPLSIGSFNWTLNGLTGFLLPGENKLTARFTDCAGSVEVSRTVFFRPDVASTLIHVIDKNGADVSGAQVFSDKFLGTTNSTGRLTITPPLQDGTQLVARKLVDITGTSFVWTRKVYQTSMRVQNNGTLTRPTTPSQPDPNTAIELRVLPENALIALNFVASIEWDASDAEINDIRDHFIRASEFLYNATDGQIIIENVDLEDDENNWSGADYRIYGNQSLRSNSSSLIKMARPQQVGVDVPIGYSDDVTYIHELGHYKFGLGDEYRDNTSGTTWCTSALFAPAGIPPSPFALNMRSAACIMSYQYSAPKYCSGRPENPHIMGTRQGSSSCWSDISNKYKDNSNPARWTIQTPDTRGAIPGAINNAVLPVNAWTPNFKIFNHNRGTLCSPIFLIVVDKNGNLLKDKEIWLNTTYGQDVHQGNTDATTGDGIWCTGFHLGDHFNNFLVTAADCALLPIPFAMHLGGGIDNMDTIPPSRIKTIVMSSAALGVKMNISPVSTGKFEIRVRMDSTSNAIKKIKIPKLNITSGDSLKQLNIPMVYNITSGEYRAVSKNFPFITDGKVKLIFDDNGQTNSAIEPFTVAQVQEKRSLMLTSENGKTTLELLPGSLAPKSRVVIGPSVVPNPPLSPGMILVIKPTNIDAGSSNNLKTEGVLSFYISGINQYNPESFQLLHFNAKTKKWERVKHSFVPYPTGIVTASTTQLGVFALTAFASK